ncbi:MAG TPA: SDR family NAD(P)-dependent oxidoreductase, partial [Symbiobacteriaceae bacterium]|nr:SDR family NAD(P)-dependent oxidoreductase [Symbiobacteriaceae bacterium]
VALVTGAGRGIGRAVALALAGAGADVGLVARTGAQVDEVAAVIRSHGGRALSVSADVSNPASVGWAVDRVAAELGPVLVLVNAAGVAPSLKLSETTDAFWHHTLAVNLTGPFLLCRAVLPGMTEKGWGRIVNIGSTAAKVGYKYNAAYVASKHGLLGLTRALALEGARHGVTVNAVCPGFVDTDIVAAAVDNLVARTGRPPEEARRTLAAFSPQERLMTPDEVAGMVAYLTTEGARGINGQAIVLDGGGVQG